MTHSDDDHITNAERAERFNSALETYCDEDDLCANLIDLLADARHWCDQQERNYAAFDRIAYRHYLVERADEARGRV